MICQSNLNFTNLSLILILIMSIGDVFFILCIANIISMHIQGVITYLGGYVYRCTCCRYKYVYVTYIQTLYIAPSETKLNIPNDKQHNVTTTTGEQLLCNYSIIIDVAIIIAFHRRRILFALTTNKNEWTGTITYAFIPKCNFNETPVVVYCFDSFSRWAFIIL